ncbi:MAG: hypothetical protein WCD35_10865 [Mycobacteriales bacterium]
MISSPRLVVGCDRSHDVPAADGTAVGGAAVPVGLRHAVPLGSLAGLCGYVPACVLVRSEFTSEPAEVRCPLCQAAVVTGSGRSPAG